MKIERLDHIVLTVKSINETIKFYTENLGMREISFGDRKALSFGNQKINLHEKGKEIEPKAKNPTCGSADICLITNIDIYTVKSEFENKGIKIIEGVVQRTGAIGKIQSIYVKDPDENLIEISNYK